MKLNKTNIFQPVESHFVPGPEKKKAITLEYFIELLRKEEDYYVDQQHDTKTMISHLRKIFYDKYGWNKELIRGAAKISNRYEVKMVEENENTKLHKPNGYIKRKRYSFEPLHLKREVVVREGDWQNHDAGTVPEIYRNDNQEVILPDTFYCDIGHVLAGMDAANYPEVVSPLPQWLEWLFPLFPYVKNNAFCATWLGDLSSCAGEFLFEKKKVNKMPDNEMRQKIIDMFAPGSDMLGNIDSIVIPEIYKLNTNTGWRVTDILHDYYFKSGKGHILSKKRFLLFCKITGLVNWDGTSFSNEKQWLRFYRKELKNTTAFYVFTRAAKPGSYIIALVTWLGFFKKTYLLDKLLANFLETLKNLIIADENTNFKKQAS